MPQAAGHNCLMQETPSAPTAFPLSIVMERTVLANNRWETEQWEAKRVIYSTSGGCTDEQMLVNDGVHQQILFPGHSVRLFRDEAEGYFLNITSAQPKVFVLWRMQNDIARPERATVSYHEGARWMDSDEKVDAVPLPPELLPAMSEFVARHYRPEVKKPKRYATNKDRGRMGRIE
jgi:hypothetical protein